MEQLKKSIAKSGSSLTIKGLVVVFMTLLLFIPTVFIRSLVYERAQRQVEASEEVAGKWGGSQTLVGPILLVPYLTTGEGKKTVKKYCHILPETLSIDGVVNPQPRKRGIFEVNVYQTTLSMEGYFTQPDWSLLDIREEDLLLNEAVLCVGISDFVGIEELPLLTWNGRELSLQTGTPASNFIAQGLSRPVDFTPKEGDGSAHRFSLRVALRGSSDLYFAPVGSSTTATLRSTWQHPSFVGSFLPSVTPDVSDSGFNATWKVLELNRSYPQAWSEGSYSGTADTFGVSLLLPTSHYTKTERSVKYALLLIALTFALYFFIELLQKKNIHPIQYVLVGAALCIFYTLLLSLSELIGFNLAYLIATVATVLLITLYSKSMLRSGKTAGILATVLSTLYGLIFMLINLEETALLFGSIGLFVLLAIVMYLSRKVDFNGEVPEPQS